MERSESDKRFDASMNLLNDAIYNVICNSEYTDMIATLIDYLDETAYNIEQVCIEDLSEYLRDDEEL